jgi:hypothetical protein
VTNGFYLVALWIEQECGIVLRVIASKAGRPFVGSPSAQACSVKCPQWRFGSEVALED